MWFRSHVTVAVAWLAAVALILSLAWELPYAMGTALKSKKAKIKGFGHVSCVSQRSIKLREYSGGLRYDRKRALSLTFVLVESSFVFVTNH